MDYLKDGQGLRRGRLCHQNGLEAPLKCCVPLNMFSELVCKHESQGLNARVLVMLTKLDITNVHANSVRIKMRHYSSTAILLPDLELHYCGNFVKYPRNYRIFTDERNSMIILNGFLYGTMYSSMSLRNEISV